mgnify:CR=1 FL=1
MDNIKKEMEEKHERKLKEDIDYFDLMYQERTNSSIILNDQKMLKGQLKIEKYIFV